VDTKLHCKYTKEGQFSVGVSAFELKHGMMEGRHDRFD
jgi:hypothetical protein